MKTFEERYTAWIDGKLEGPALTAFELELSRRASAGEARADKQDAARLHGLLTRHLAAPAMTNTEFFSHQLRERIEADRATDRRKEASRAAWPSLFAWSFGRLAGVGGACLFVAAALYYGLMPQNVGSPRGMEVAKTTSTQSPGVLVAQADTTPAQSAAVPTKHDPSQPVELARREPLPPDIDDDAPADIQKVEVDHSKPATATPLHYAKPDVNVIWINGLDYLPTVPGDNAPGAPAAASPAAPAPSVSAQP